jgi:hypothetical protein
MTQGETMDERPKSHALYLPAHPNPERAHAGTQPLTRARR